MFSCIIYYVNVAQVSCLFTFSVAGAMMVSLSSSLTDGGQGFHSGALFAVGGAIL